MIITTRQQHQTRRDAVTTLRSCCYCSGGLPVLLPWEMSPLMQADGRAMSPLTDGMDIDTYGNMNSLVVLATQRNATGRITT